MNDHLTDDDLLPFLRGDLPRARVTAVVRHLGACERCASAAEANGRVARSSAALARQMEEDEHPPVESLLTGFVDGTLGDAGREQVAVHLESCGRCREDVADLHAAALVLRSPRRSAWPRATAAAAVVLIATALLVTRMRLPQGKAPSGRALTTSTATSVRPAPQQPPVMPSPVVAPEWSAALAAALRGGSVVMPAALAELQVQADPQRAPGTSRPARMEPSSAIVETDRPLLRWTPAAKASYEVTIFDGSRVVADSGSLRQPQWRPERALLRGRLYHWQVRVRGRGVDTILPAPPAPPALFRVLDRATHEELVNARAATGGDPLLLGVLYARAGLRTEAEQELSRVDTPDGRRLLNGVKAWGSREAPTGR
jgi:anti-sigma factor RsiW